VRELASRHEGTQEGDAAPDVPGPVVALPAFDYQPAASALRSGSPSDSSRRPILICLTAQPSASRQASGNKGRAGRWARSAPAGRLDSQSKTISPSGRGLRFIMAEGGTAREQGSQQIDVREDTDACRGSP
jgi:hypothetical protein